MLLETVSQENFQRCVFSDNRLIRLLTYIYRQLIFVVNYAGVDYSCKEIEVEGRSITLNIW